jgi:parallel beta-helix repeat protein
MKTLSQVEPRTPITNLPYTIAARGSYYLVTNLFGQSGFDGITISAPDVTLDLCGFTLLGVPGSHDGIHLGVTYDNLEIRNGVIRDWDGDGLDVYGASNVRIADLRVYQTGANGIFSGTHALIESCFVDDAGTNGIYVKEGGEVAHCTVSGCGGIGIQALFGGRVHDNTVRYNGFEGIVVRSGCVVANNVCQNNGQDAIKAAIRAELTANRIENNQCVQNPLGIEVQGTNNYIAGNTVLQNGANYSFDFPDNMINILLCEIPQNITWPCTVTLAGTLTGRAGENGITIASDHVTIDLNGCALRGVASSQDGIHANTGFRGVTVRNGTVCNWMNDGLDLALADDVQIFGVQSLTNRFDGIEVGVGSLIKDSTAAYSGEDGIRAEAGSVLVNCTAARNDETGFNVDTGCTVTACNSYDNGGAGFVVGENCLVDRCTAMRNGTTGFYLADGSSMSSCCVGYNANGIQADGMCTIVGNTVDRPTSAGIRVHGSRFRIEGNNITLPDNGGIVVTNTGNLIVKNSVSGDDPYLIADGNATGHLVNVSGGSVVTNYSWANIAF